MKRITFSLLMMLCTLCSIAAGLQVSAPSHVAVGEQFRLSYTVNTHDVSGIQLGAVPSAFEVLVGPSTSSSSSFQMVNGKMSSNESTTFTYVLMANKNGTFTIPPARATSKGQTITSGSVTISVSGKASAGASQQQQQQRVRPAGSKVTGNDLFIAVSASKKRVYEQEPILLTYKVYTQVELTALDGKMPDLKGFHTQEIPLPQQKKFTMETHNGKTYQTVVWSKYLMYPQVTGSLTIPSITFEGTVLHQNTNVDPWDAFFNGGMGYSEVSKKIVAPAVNIQVDPLPDRPKDFSGGVGHFDMQTSLKAEEPKSGEPMTLTVTISGQGNLKLIKQPTVHFPKDFDKYDPKTEDNTRLTERGLEGSVVYEYLFVPRHKGKYTIPPVEFTYYDTEANDYRTLKGEPFTIDVAKGTDGADYSEQEVLQMLNKDIRYMKSGDAHLIKRNQHFFGSVGYFLGIIIPLVVFAILVVVFRKRAIDAANIAKTRGKKANSVAVKRLKVAGKLLQQGQQNEFYYEVLRALWGYAGDKLNMPVETLSKDNVREKFSSVGVDETLTTQFEQVLNDCEFAQFAPGDKQDNMKNVYNSAADVIDKIETQIKSQSSKRGNMKEQMQKGLIVLMLFSAMSMHSMAATKAEADSAYANEDYRKAVQIYEQLLKEGDDANIFYNLGNAYYREKNFTRAVLNYERALLLSPGDKDIRFNLDMARSKTIDRIVPESEMFFVSWYHSIVNMMSVDAWAKIAIVCLVMCLALLLLYLLNKKRMVRTACFFASLMLFVFFILANVFAWDQRNQQFNRNTGIIISPSVSVKSTPANNGTDLFIIHEGTKVRITDNSMKEWKEIVLADGKKGWIETEKMERI